MVKKTQKRSNNGQKNVKKIKKTRKTWNTMEKRPDKLDTPEKITKISNKNQLFWKKSRKIQLYWKKKNYIEKNQKKIKKNQLILIQYYLNMATNLNRDPYTWDADIDRNHIVGRHQNGNEEWHWHKAIPCP